LLTSSVAFSIDPTWLLPCPSRPGYSLWGHVFLRRKDAEFFLARMNRGVTFWEQFDVVSCNNFWLPPWRCRSIIYTLLFDIELSRPPEWTRRPRGCFEALNGPSAGRTNYVAISEQPSSPFSSTFSPQMHTRESAVIYQLSLWFKPGSMRTKKAKDRRSSTSNPILSYQWTIEPRTNQTSSWTFTSIFGTR